MKKFFFHLAALPLLLSVFMVLSCEPSGTDDPDPSSAKGLRFRYFIPTLGGLTEAQNVGDEVNISCPMGYGKMRRVVFYVTEADDGAPLPDEVESHYTFVNKEADPEVQDLEEEDICVEQLGEKVSGEYFLWFISPGTATVTLKYDDGAGKVLEKTMKVTVNNVIPHELEVRWGPWKSPGTPNI